MKKYQNISWFIIIVYLVYLVTACRNKPNIPLLENDTLEWITLNPDSLDIYLEDVYNPTMYILKIKSSNETTGIYSFEKNQSAKIFLNGNIVWSKKLQYYDSIYNRYYALKNNEILTTIIIRKSGNHKVSFNNDEQVVWKIDKLEIANAKIPSKIKGIGYSPYRDCQFPGGKYKSEEPTLEQVKEDIIQLSHTCNAIRTYSTSGINKIIPKLAKKVDLKVYAGVWINGDIKEDSLEVESILKLCKSVDLDGIIVGNEFFLRNRYNFNIEKVAGSKSAEIKSASSEKTAIDYLLKWILKVKENISNKNIKVTTAELASFQFNDTGIKEIYRPILNEVDIVMVHIYPFWDKQNITDAALQTVNKYNQIKDILKKEFPAHPKELIIGETGWPSYGNNQGKAVPSLYNQRKYYYEFLELAEKNNVEFFYFDAFDELWKIEEQGGVGQHWGYSFSDRSAKHELYGILVPGLCIPNININNNKKILERTGLDKYIDSPYYPIYSEWPIDMYYHWIIKDGKSRYFYPSGFMGDYEKIEMNCCDRSNPHSGEMSTKIKLNLSGEKGWSGIYWLPDAKWDGKGINIYEILSTNQFNSKIKLFFWAKGNNGNEKIQFKIGGINDSDDSIEFASSTGWIILSKKWKQYEIPLNKKDLSNLVGGFCCISEKKYNQDKNEIVFFLDDIYLIKSK